MRFTAVYFGWLRESSSARASDAAMGAWLRLCAHCVSNELAPDDLAQRVATGQVSRESPIGPGLIRGCKKWDARDWMRVAAVNLRGVKASVDAQLCNWIGSDLEVTGVDLWGISRVHKVRKNGSTGGRPPNSNEHATLVKPNENQDGTKMEPIENLEKPKPHTVQYSTEQYRSEKNSAGLRPDASSGDLIPISPGDSLPPKKQSAKQLAVMPRVEAIKAFHLGWVEAHKKNGLPTPSSWVDRERGEAWNALTKLPPEFGELPPDRVPEALRRADIALAALSGPSANRLWWMRDATALTIGLFGQRIDEFVKPLKITKARGGITPPSKVFRGGILGEDF